MRMRKKKNGTARLSVCNHWLVGMPQAPISRNDIFFPAEQPLALEIGCGKGNFACTMAEKHPNTNFLALERVSDVMVLAVEKARAREEHRAKDNLRFMIADAKSLEEILLPDTVDAIYLNFSDPWPKKGYAKRRLTYRAFLEVYFRLLKAGGRLCFKTDNRPLFDFTLEELAALGYTCETVSYDLHHSAQAADNVMTEYEANFSAMGIPICALTVVCKK